MLRLLRARVRINPLLMKEEETVKKEEDIHTSFAFTSQTAKVMATACEKCSVKMIKALNLFKKIL